MRIHSVKTFPVILFFLFLFSCAGFQIRKGNYETIDSILDNYPLKKDTTDIPLRDKYRALIKFVQDSEESKAVAINPVIRDSFPECNAIRYLEIKKLEAISNESKIERYLYFTTFNTLFNSGDSYTSVILRVRIVIESIREKEKSRFITTFTLEDRGYDSPDNGSKPDGKIDGVIKSNIKFPVMKDKDVEQSYEPVLSLYQEAFDNAVAIFYDEYMF